LALMKTILYAAAGVVFLAANLFTVSLGPAQLSLYRLCLAGAAGLLFLMMLGLPNEARLPLRQKNSFSVAFLLEWFAWAAFSVLWVQDLSLWLKALYFIGTGAFWTVCYSLFFHEERQILRVFYVMQGAILFVSAIGWYEVATKDYRFIPMTPENIHALVDAPARVPIALSGNPNDFALVVLFGIFISFACMRLSRSLLGKAISAGAMVSSLGLLAFSESRANLLGLVLGAGMYVILTCRDKKRIALLVLLGAAGLGIFMTTPYWGLLLEKAASVMRFDFHSGTYNSESVRIRLIINGLSFLPKTWWMGTGAGNIEYWMAHDTVVNTNGYVNIHNWWLELLASFGVIFFVLYLVFYLRLWKNLLRRYAQSAQSGDRVGQELAGAFCCCMAAFLMGSISSSSNMKTEWLWVFWAVAIAFEGTTPAPVTKDTRRPLPGRKEGEGCSCR